MEQKIEKILYGAGIFFLAVMSVGFWGISVKYVLLILFALCAAYGIIYKKLYLDIEMFFLLSGMFIYSIGAGNETDWIIKITLLPFLFYVYGKVILPEQDKSTCKYRTKMVVIVLSLGLLISSILNAVSYYKYGFENGRAWKEFWTGILLPATQHVFWNLIIVALVFYGIYYWKRSRFLNSVLVLGGLWSVWFSLLTGSRITVLVFGIVFLLNIILYCCFNWKDERKKGYIIKGLIGSAVLSVLLAAMYMLNVGGIFTPIKESYMWTRNGGILHNIRFQAQLTILKQLFAHPFGGREIEAELYYAHNVWLDMANSGGLLPFVLILVYTIFSAVNLFKFVLRQDISQEIKYLLVSAYTSFFCIIWLSLL